MAKQVRALMPVYHAGERVEYLPGETFWVDLDIDAESLVILKRAEYVSEPEQTAAPPVEAPPVARHALSVSLPDENPE